MGSTSLPQSNNLQLPQICQQHALFIRAFLARAQSKVLRRAPAVGLVLEAALEPRQVRLFVLPRHQEPVRRRERLAQDERQIVDPGFLTIGAGVDQVSAVEHQQFALVAGDVEQSLQSIDGILPRIDSAVDPMELAQEDAGFVRFREAAPSVFAAGGA
ncbi:hypothetical protein PG994_013653 [Apiospora phragmitis]|uniref:Uncharacterized protein n=1 Tax=Apiospora phragmitis TaxID=2905665 RepID=A0ABR1T987_9PEZI